MILVRTRDALAGAMSTLRASGATALVPTMGFLHEGHLSLVDRARELADRAVVSIFVNPLQFGPAEDLATYPRDEARDLSLLEARGADLVFVPAIEEMYPSGEPAVTVSPGRLEDRLCGRYRPGHFSGVLTVVAKLFGLVRPDVAVFGRKDFQQAVLIRRMVQDLNLGVRVETGPIVREPDGLAMSSRNAYLSDGERAQAVGLSRALLLALGRFHEGESGATALLEAVKDELARFPLLRLQYAELVDPEGLDSVDPAESGSVLALAAFCGTTRLIDNVELS
ncbi:MAG: pantoate--beta-alanine ligase [Gemmatimonadetes bacterium]|nr:pantoate--beta-alanine ligase [Gemmatimonadota bacterium]